MNGGIPLKKANSQPDIIHCSESTEVLTQAGFFTSEDRLYFWRNGALHPKIQKYKNPNAITLLRMTEKTLFFNQYF
jgi:hypothetical protein